jgi:GntR family transcriptional regulator/MocR family aminotransferase
LRHVRRMRRVYRARRDIVVEGLRASAFAGRLSFEVPRGGMALWAQVHTGSAEAWAQAAAAGGVGVSVAADYALDRKARPFLRLGWSALDEKELREALRRLTRSCAKVGHP